MEDCLQRALHAVKAYFKINDLSLSKLILSKHFLWETMFLLTFNHCVVQA